MATDHKISVDVNIKGDALSSSITSAIADALEKTMSNSRVGGIGSSSAASGDNLGDNLKSMTMAIQNMTNTQDQSSQKLFAQFKQAEASYNVRKGEYDFKTPGQQGARAAFGDAELKELKNAQELSSLGDEKIRLAREGIAYTSLANKEAAEAAAKRRNMANGFNTSELLMAAAARSMTNYMTAGQTLSVGSLGTGGSDLASLYVKSQNAQRNAVSDAVQAGLPALGLQIGGMLGGPVGSLVGAGVGYAASIPISLLMAARSAGETQRLTLEQLSGTGALYGGGSPGSSTSTALPGTGFFGTNMGKLSANLDPRTSMLVGGGNGPLASIYDNALLPFQQYRRSKTGLTDSYLGLVGSVSATSGEDPRALHSAVAYGSSLTGMSPEAMLMFGINAGKNTGMTATDALTMATSLTSTTALGSMPGSRRFMENTSQYGGAFQGTAIGYQGENAFSKIGQNAKLAMFGIDAKKLFTDGDPAELEKYRKTFSGMNEEVAGVSLGDMMGTIVNQGNTQAHYSIMSARPGNDATRSPDLTQGDVRNAAPTAYKNAVENAKMEIGKATIIIRGQSALSSDASYMRG